MDFLRPATWREALEAKAAHPDATPIAGGTDVMVEINFDHRRPSTLLDLNRIDELASWSEVDGRLRIGAGLPYVKKQRKLFYTGIFGLFTVSATMHALFNLLIQSDYSWLGACFPMVLYVLFYVVRRTGRIRLPFLPY